MVEGARRRVSVPWAPVLRDADEQTRLFALTGRQLQLSSLGHTVGSLLRSGSLRPLALQLQVLELKPALGASQLGVGCLRAGGSSLDIDTPAEHKASNRDPGCTGRSRPFVVVVEAADDPGPAYMNLGVFGHHDGDVADDRGGVDSRLAIDEPVLAQVDIALAYHRQPPGRCARPSIGPCARTLQ